MKLIFIFLLISCQKAPTILKAGESYTGPAMNGQEITCTHKTDQICTMVLRPVDDYIRECISKNELVVKCDCDQAICLEN
jgi:hypothetical protein